MPIRRMTTGLATINCGQQDGSLQEGSFRVVEGRVTESIQGSLYSTVGR